MTDILSYVGTVFVLVGIPLIAACLMLDNRAHDAAHPRCTNTGATNTDPTGSEEGH